MSFFVILLSPQFSNTAKNVQLTSYIYIFQKANASKYTFGEITLNYSTKRVEMRTFFFEELASQICKSQKSQHQKSLFFI